MSAFMVDRNHVAYLVEAAIRWGLITPGQGGKVGTILWRENRKSIEARYPDTIGTDEHFAENAPGAGDAGNYGQHSPWIAIINPMQVVCSCDCLDYQSCEHSGWTDSAAKKMLDCIRVAAVALCGESFAAWYALPYEQKRAPQYRAMVAEWDAVKWGAPQSDAVQAEMAAETEFLY